LFIVPIAAFSGGASIHESGGCLLFGAGDYLLCCRTGLWGKSNAFLAAKKDDTELLRESPLWEFKRIKWGLPVVYVCFQAGLRFFLEGDVGHFVVMIIIRTPIGANNRADP